MFRYIGAIWNAADAEQASAARTLLARVGENGMTRVFSVEGMELWCDKPSLFNHIHQLENSSGVILGTLFNGRSAISPDGTEEIVVANEGRILISNYWGRYVAFLFDAASSTARVVRDPSGGLYCLQTTWQGIGLYFSDVNDCLRLGLRFTIDWQFVAAHLSAWIVEGERTLLREIRNVLPGMCVETCKGVVTRRRYWSAAAVATGDVIEDRDKAAGVLREAVVTSVQAWSSLHEGVLVHLSGGLDSSIVMVCLGSEANKQAVYGLNYHADGADSDERRYARCAADWAGRPLIERPRNARVDLSRMLTCKRSTKLDFNVLRFETSRTEAELAHEIGATAVMTGGGGDQVFGSGRARLAAADYARSHGVLGEFVPIALRAALLERRSIWSVFGYSLIHGILRCRRNPMNDTYAVKKLVTRETLALAAATQSEYHAWWNGADDLPAGKLAHVADLCGRDMHDPLEEPNDPDQIEPLMSSLVVNACLRTAMHVMSCDDWDRGLARRAFSDALPPQIARRRNKGAANEHMLGLRRHNLPFGRALLLDGVLIQQQLLDRQALQAALSDSPASAAHVMELFHVLSTEARLRAWL